MFRTITNLINRVNGNAQKQQATDLVAAFALYAGKEQTCLMSEIAAFTAQVEQRRTELLEGAATVETTMISEVTRQLEAANAQYKEMLAEAERLLLLAKADAEVSRAEARDDAASKRRQAKDLEAQVAQLRTLVGAFASA